MMDFRRTDFIAQDHWLICIVGNLKTQYIEINKNIEFLG